MSTDEALAFLFGGRPHLLAAPMETWLSSSRRFADFVATFRTKIRKKVRTTREAESVRDLHLELETAFLLLRERSLRLEYEPQPGGRARGPDFAVAFTTSSVFMVEVTRLQADPSAAAQERADTTQMPPAASPLAGERFAAALGRKLGQLHTGHSNVLLVGVDIPPPTQADLDAAMLAFQLRAERNDPAVVRRPGFRSRSDLFGHYRRLSGVLVRGVPLQPGDTAVVWENPQASRPLSGRIRTALARSHTP